MRVWLCGVRGSTPAPGPQFTRTGGHTSCVALAHDGEPPRLILDAGTGIRRLADVLRGEPFRGALLLGHLHWDHTTGLPFFGAGDRDGARVDLRLPAQARDAESLLGRAMSPPHFPIEPRELRGCWSFSSIDEGVHHIEGFEVLAREIPHKGGRTFGYRVRDGAGATVAYLSDHGPLAMGDGPSNIGAIHDAAMALAADAHLLLHDAQYTVEELARRRAFGHSAADYAAHLAAAARVRRLLLFHHEPTRRDDEIDAIAAGVQARNPDVDIDVAREGMVIDL